jgi:hypothetical protein
MLPQQQLPQPFRALEPFLEWSLATERQRVAKRQGSTMAEIQAFYMAMIERLDEVLSLLSNYSDEAPDEVKRLFYLTLSLAEVAPAVENFGQPSVVDGYAWSRFIPDHD